MSRLIRRVRPICHLPKEPRPQITPNVHLFPSSLKPPGPGYQYIHCRPDPGGAGAVRFKDEARS
eukprot:1152030-Pelagomonas_calceolata.AAC.12